MENCLKGCLERVISEEQSGFSKGRKILEGIIMTHETIHSIKLRKKEGMLIKLDMNKVFNRVSWYFLIKFLCKFGFAKEWCDWVLSYISSTSFSIMVNGVPSRPFSARHKLLQGDPLSPFLFIILAEALGRTIKAEALRGSLTGLQVSGGFSNITHLQFLDNTLLFGEASTREARCLKRILSLYESRSSGELLQI